VAAMTLKKNVTTFDNASNIYKAGFQITPVTLRNDPNGWYVIKGHEIYDTQTPVYFNGRHLDLL